MQEFIALCKIPEGGFIKGHLLDNLSKGKEYAVINKWCKSKVIVNDIGVEVMISNTLLKKHFKVIEGENK